MKIPDKIYDLIKWLLIIVVPAFVTLFPTLANVWHWDIPVDAIVTTITAVATFIGVCVGISTISYNRQQKNDGDISDFKKDEDN